MIPVVRVFIGEPEPFQGELYVVVPIVSRRRRRS
jgi:hypothetical protein